jgi:hypothetical protein
MRLLPDEAIPTAGKARGQVSSDIGRMSSALHENSDWERIDEFGDRCSRAEWPQVLTGKHFAAIAEFGSPDWSKRDSAVLNR